MVSFGLSCIHGIRDSRVRFGAMTNGWRLRGLRPLRRTRRGRDSKLVREVVVSKLVVRWEVVARRVAHLETLSAIGVTGVGRSFGRVTT